MPGKVFVANVPPPGCRDLWVASILHLCSENPLKSSRFSYQCLSSHSLKNSPEMSQFSPLHKIYNFFFFAPVFGLLLMFIIPAGLRAQRTHVLAKANGLSRSLKGAAKETQVAPHATGWGERSASSPQDP